MQRQSEKVAFFFEGGLGVRARYTLFHFVHPSFHSGPAHSSLAIPIADAKLLFIYIKLG